MRNTYRWVWLCIAITCALNINVFAQMTPAGTQISLQASATYLDSSNNSYSAVSNVVTLTVAQVAGVEVTLAVQNATLNPGTSYNFPVTVKNTGNGDDYYQLSTDTLPSGWSVVFVQDTNGNGQRDANENTTISRTPTLRMGEEYKIFVTVTAPPDPVTGSSVQNLPFRVTSNFDNQRFALNSVSADVVNPFTPLWTATVPGGVQGDVTITGGKAFIGSSTGQLYAFSVSGQSAGTQVWSTPVNIGAGMTGRISAMGSMLFVPTADGRVQLVDAGSGSVQGTRTVASGVSIVASPVVQNGILFVPAQDGRIRAFDANGMLIAVSNQWGTQFSSTPSAPGTTHLWAGTGDGFVVCFRSSDLQGVWMEMVSPGQPVTSSPWIDIRTNTLFIGGQNGLFYAMNATPDPSVPHVRWVYDAGSAIVGSPFFDWVAKVVYFGTVDGKIHAVKADDGTAKSGYPIQPRDAGRFLGMPIVVRKSGSNTPYIYIGSDTGKFYAINADNPQEFYLYDGTNNGESFVRSPSISGLSESDVIVAASANGKVLAFPLK
ncbi:MAG: PQQ-binding-like beta-propeller repeat protein [Chthonomonadetes bacterium]|nr:PQQ-binding-like beta-propeller repeat protein [Chthonomonadetes bacterium]